MNKKIETWCSVKVPKKLHELLKWVSFQRKKYIYQIIAEMLMKELKGEKNDSNY